MPPDVCQLPALGLLASVTTRQSCHAIILKQLSLQPSGTLFPSKGSSILSLLIYADGTSRTSSPVVGCG